MLPMCMVMCITPSIQQKKLNCVYIRYIKTRFSVKVDPDFRYISRRDLVYTIGRSKFRQS